MNKHESMGGEMDGVGGGGIGGVVKWWDGTGKVLDEIPV